MNRREFFKWWKVNKPEEYRSFMGHILFLSVSILFFIVSVFLQLQNKR